MQKYLICSYVSEPSAHILGRKIPSITNIKISRRRKVWNGWFWSKKEMSFRYLKLFDLYTLYVWINGINYWPYYQVCICFFSPFVCLWTSSILRWSLYIYPWFTHWLISPHNALLSHLKLVPGLRACSCYIPLVASILNKIIIRNSYSHVKKNYNIIDVFSSWESSHFRTYPLTISPPPPP